MAKRYMVFAGAWYYPSGGAGDFRHASSSLKVASAYAKAESLAYQHGYSDGWAHVFDANAGTIVERWKAGEPGPVDDEWSEVNPGWSRGERNA
jgi:hypothetical protein